MSHKLDTIWGSTRVRKSIILLKSMGLTYAFPENERDAYPLIQQSMMFLAREDMFESATEVLLEAMQQPSWSRYDSLRNDLLNCFVSDWMRGTFSRCIEGIVLSDTFFHKQVKWC